MQTTQKLMVTYLHHSGFMVRSSDRLLLFDFYGDPQRPDEVQKNIACVTDAIRDPAVRHVYVFASHNHRDHFDPVILTLDQYDKPITWLFSSDIKEVVKKQQDMYFLDADEQAEIDDLSIHTFASTDEGIAFLVIVDGIHLFHAGDLNWWYWYDESTAEECAEYERDFKKIMAQVETWPVDVAFFPVDPRLKEYAHHGGAYFIEKLKPAFFFPMHFSYAYDTTVRFKDQIAQSHSDTAVLTIKRQRETYELEVPQRR
ncbi:MAG: MBL fold metallo-hydrolase [Bacillota bacterium]|nr:MBL fold metallo-hydrolase [Bacillota bacterium]